MHNEKYKHLDIIVNRTGNWAERTFPESTVHTILAHAKDELKEVEDEINKHPCTDPMYTDDIAEEIADVFLLLCHLCFKLRISLLDAAYKKLEKNMNRKWETKINSKGFFSHIDE